MSWHQNAYYARRRAKEAVEKAAFTERQAALLDAGGQLMELDQLEADLKKRLERDHNAGKHPGFDYEGCSHCARRLDPKPHSRVKREEGAVGDAIRYMGECPCGARIIFGDVYQVVEGKLWHYGCAVRGRPVRCRVCGRDFMPSSENRFPVCVTWLCWGAWQVAVWGPLRLINQLTPSRARWK